MPNDRLIEDLGKTIGNAQFQGLVKEIDAQPPSERIAFAKRLATVDELKKRGIPLPEGFRITTRVFENPSDMSSQFDETGKQIAATSAAVGPTVCVSVGAGIIVNVCVSVGGEI